MLTEPETCGCNCNCGCGNSLRYIWNKVKLVYPYVDLLLSFGFLASFVYLSVWVLPRGDDVEVNETDRGLEWGLLVIFILKVVATSAYLSNIWYWKPKIGQGNDAKVETIARAVKYSVLGVLVVSGIFGVIISFLHSELDSSKKIILPLSTAYHILGLVVLLECKNQRKDLKSEENAQDEEAQEMKTFISTK